MKLARNAMTWRPQLGSRSGLTKPSGGRGSCRESCQVSDGALRARPAMPARSGRRTAIPWMLREWTTPEGSPNGGVFCRELTSRNTGLREKQVLCGCKLGTECFIVLACWIDRKEARKSYET